MESTLGLSVALTSLLLYFLPVIIAFVRGHESHWVHCHVGSLEIIWGIDSKL